MRTSFAVVRTTLFKAWTLILLASVHFIGTYFEFNKAERTVGRAHAVNFTTYFLGVGVFILFLGLTDLLALPGLRTRNKAAWNLAALNSGFSLLAGAIATSVFGVSPPTIMLACGLLGGGVLFWKRGEFQPSSAP